MRAIPISSFFPHYIIRHNNVSHTQMFKPEGRLPIQGNAFTRGFHELNLEQNGDLLDNAVISAFSKRCPNLVKLNLSYCRLSSDCLFCIAIFFYVPFFFALQLSVSLPSTVDVYMSCCCVPVRELNPTV